jgi:acetolactate decarboxylase
MRHSGITSRSLNSWIVSESFGRAFFVWAEVPRWVERTVPAELRSYEDLELFVPKAAAAAGLDAEHPLPFLATGREDMETHKKVQIKFELRQTQATIVGFHSTRHRGVFTPCGSNIHIHFQTPDNRQSGHIQRLESGDGARLSVPVA